MIMYLYRLRMYFEDGSEEAVDIAADYEDEAKRVSAYKAFLAGASDWKVSPAWKDDQH
jgi:hypothetical protein